MVFKNDQGPVVYSQIIKFWTDKLDEYTKQYPLEYHELNDSGFYIYIHNRIHLVIMHGIKKIAILSHYPNITVVEIQLFFEELSTTKSVTYRIDSRMDTEWDKLEDSNLIILKSYVIVSHNDYTSKNYHISLETFQSLILNSPHHKYLYEKLIKILTSIWGVKLENNNVSIPIGYRK